MNSIKGFFIGASFMIVFGMIDNLGLFIGMGSIEEFLYSFGYSPIVAAGIGNAFSDAIGALFGGMVATSLHKILKIDKKVTILQEVVGVIIGCLIPVMVLMLIF